MDEKLVRKIEKLLKLGNGSCYTGESETALKMAYDLMRENNISIEDVGRISREEKLGELGKTKMTEEEKQFRKWEMSLLAAIARLFDCQVLRTGYHSAYYKKADLSIVGREANRITAKLMYDWIHDKTKKEARYLDGYHQSTRTAYCVGVASAISKKVNELKDAAPKTDAWGLVPIDEVAQWIKDNTTNPKDSSISFGRIRDAMAYQHGREVGDKTSLNRQFGLKALEAK